MYTEEKRRPPLNEVAITWAAQQGSGGRGSHEKWVPHTSPVPCLPPPLPAAAQDEGVGLREAVRAAAGGRAVPATAAQARGAAAQNTRRLLSGLCGSDAPAPCAALDFPPLTRLACCAVCRACLPPPLPLLLFHCPPVLLLPFLPRSPAHACCPLASCSRLTASAQHMPLP